MKIVVALALLAAIGSTATVFADREQQVPTQWQWRHGRTQAQITALINQGYRVVDIEVESSNPLRFAAAFVSNTGAYAMPTTWIPSISPANLQLLVSLANLRIIDLERYTVGNQVWLSCIVVPNVGPYAKAWWWHTNRTAQEVADLIASTRGRIVDIDTFNVGSQRRYSVVLVANTGDDAKAWWWYPHYSWEYISEKLIENNARLYDIERHSDGLYTAVMIRRTGERIWRYRGLTESGLNDRWRQHGARVFDLESYGSGNQKRFNALMIGNSNELTYRIYDQIDPQTDGWFGFRLKEVSGPVLASINPLRPFYPASTIKVNQHYVAMLAVQNNAADLQETVMLWDNTCADNHQNDTGTPTTLQNALVQMMQPSSNVASNTVQERFNRQVINLVCTIFAGMTNGTWLHYKFGCGGPNNNPANVGVLTDFNTFYERMTLGQLLDDETRTTFYALMLNETNSNLLGSMDNDEAAKVGLSTAQFNAWRSNMTYAYKAGNIGSAYVSIAGSINLPYQSRTGITTRSLVFGAFIDQATVNNASIFTITRELLRDEVNKSMQTFK